MDKLRIGLFLGYKMPVTPSTKIHICPIFFINGFFTSMKQQVNFGGLCYAYNDF